MPSDSRGMNLNGGCGYDFRGNTGVWQEEAPKNDSDGASCLPARIQISADKPWENICSRLVSHINCEGGIS